MWDWRHGQLLDAGSISVIPRAVLLVPSGVLRLLLFGVAKSKRALAELREKGLAD